MKDILLQIKKYIPEDVINNLPIKSFKAGDIILDIESDYFLIMLEGALLAVRYHKGHRIIYPYIWKKDSMAGFNMLLVREKKNWEFTAITSGKALVFPVNIVEKYIFQEPSSFKFFVEENIKIMEIGLKSFYILAHGGAKAYLALLFVEGSQNNIFPFRKYENFAEVLGISRSMLFRITKEFIEEGLIKKERKKIIILNALKLKDLYKEYLYF